MLQAVGWFCLEVSGSRGVGGDSVESGSGGLLWSPCFTLEVQKLQFEGQRDPMHSAQDELALAERPELRVLSRFLLWFLKSFH